MKETAYEENFIYFCPILSGLFILICIFAVYLLKEPLHSSQYVNVSTSVCTVYTPGIYADGYIVFAFSFVHSSILMFVGWFIRSLVRSLFRNVRGIYVQVFVKVFLVVYMCIS